MSDARFPPDFMFQLTAEETANLRCQIGTSSSGYGGRRYRPYAFTEQGVAMLSSVLRSERAVQVNVAIMRAFVSLRRMLAANETLAKKLAKLERHLTRPHHAATALRQTSRRPAGAARPPNETDRLRSRDPSGPLRFLCGLDDLPPTAMTIAP
jgi:hypothetical protein